MQVNNAAKNCLRFPLDVESAKREVAFFSSCLIIINSVPVKINFGNEIKNTQKKSIKYSFVFLLIEPQEKKRKSRTRVL